VWDWSLYPDIHKTTFRILYYARWRAHSSARLRSALPRTAPRCSAVFPRGCRRYKIRVLCSRGQFKGWAGLHPCAYPPPASPHPTALRSAGGLPLSVTLTPSQRTATDLRLRVSSKKSSRQYDICVGDDNIKSVGYDIPTGYFVLWRGQGAGALSREGGSICSPRKRRGIADSPTLTKRHGICCATELPIL
jgi:hypothetical protein